MNADWQRFGPSEVLNARTDSSVEFNNQLFVREMKKRVVVKDKTFACTTVKGDERTELWIWWR